MPREVHYHIKSYVGKDLPPDNDELAQWCKDRWREKEARLRDFYTNREFRESATENGPASEVRDGTDKYRRVKEATGQKQYLSFILSVTFFTILNVLITYLHLYLGWGFLFLGIVLSVMVMYESYFGKGLDKWLMSFCQKEIELAKARAEKVRAENAMALSKSSRRMLLQNGIVENGTCNVLQES